MLKGPLMLKDTYISYILVGGCPSVSVSTSRCLWVWVQLEPQQSASQSLVPTTDTRIPRR